MVRLPVGHTAYHHLGASDCAPGQRKPHGSSPYFLFGAQRRYPYAWHGGAGGVPSSRVASSSRELGIFDLLESSPPGAQAYSAFKRTTLHDTMGPYVPTGDWPLVRPAGPEPDGPYGDGLGLSDNEKKLGMVLALGALGFLVWKKLGVKRNPVRKRFEVLATARRKGQKGFASSRLEYAGSFAGKRGADEYASYLRKIGRKARTKKR